MIVKHPLTDYNRSLVFIFGFLLPVETDIRGSEWYKCETLRDGEANIFLDVHTLFINKKISTSRLS